MKTEDTSPGAVVAIVGRPNVGKSALFNRLVGRRLAIVHEEEGVTRDRLVSKARWNDRLFSVIDTGGLALMDKARTSDAIMHATAEQVRAAIEDAAVVILTVDIQAGPQPMDEEVLRLLRQSNRPVFIAANKADEPDQDELTDAFARFGAPVFPVSASHNRGLDDLMAAVMKQMPDTPPETEHTRMKVAVIGRPNVGKSSYINRLTGKSRVIVSNIPGTTRDTIEVPFTLQTRNGPRHYTLFDTAGMRRQGKVHESVEKFSLFRAERCVSEADIIVLVMDAEAGPTTQDKKLAALINEHHKACVVLVNKWDLAKGKGVKSSDYEDAMRKALFFLDDTPVVFVSAKSGHRIKHSFDVIDELASRLETKLPTGVLNRAIRDAFARTQPPFARGRQLKFYYATQTGERPPCITLFVNDPTLNGSTYHTYLMNRLRKSFNLSGIPLILRYRSSHEKKEDK